MYIGTRIRVGEVRPNLINLLHERIILHKALQQLYNKNNSNNNN